MSISLFSFVDLYRRQLDTAEHLLAKGIDHAAAQDIEEREMLGWRLAEDMHPFAFQLIVVVNFSQLWLARAAAVAAPTSLDWKTLDGAGIQAAITGAKGFLATLTPAQFDGRDDLVESFEIMPGMAPSFSIAHWLSVFATTNIYFHTSAAYAILRTKHVALSKIDMFPGGL